MSGASRAEPSSWAIVALAVAMIGVGLWTARALDSRSLVRVPLNHDVVSLNLRHEKHPGADDRYFVSLRASQGGETQELEVTRAVHLSLTEGSHVSKVAGETSLVIDDTRMSLEDDPLLWGLRIALLAAVSPAILMLVALGLLRR